MLGVLVTASGLWALGLLSDAFPHEEHAGLFPLCAGCHSGIETGVEAELYPLPDDCGSCHDGEREERVDWAGPSPLASNLEFSHTEHTELVTESGDTVDCGFCHQAPGSAERMAVVLPTAEGCLDCHAHEAPEHLSEVRDCRECHVPLALASRLPVARIEAFEQPSGHEAENFLVRHEPESDQALGACQTCHAEESCTRCHLNAADLPSVASLDADPRVASIVAAKPPEYPEPETHDDIEWSWQHGGPAYDDATSCANCHSQDSCVACHEAGGAQEIESLPRIADDDPRGVRFTHEPVVHETDIVVSHQASGTANEGACQSCHTVSFCEACHNGPIKPAFHFGNFLQMHGPEAWGNEVECATCHNTDVFCRGCHDAVGLGSEGRLDVAYHSGRPFWLFGHGAAARQGLETCRTCHSQADCTICHAAVGSWRINPHGPGFEADRLREANPQPCVVCHRTGIPPT
jgi:hypothetical protein